MIYSINLQDLGAKELVLVCKNNTPSVPFYSAYRFLTFVLKYKVVA